MLIVCVCKVIVFDVNKRIEYDWVMYLNIGFYKMGELMVFDIFGIISFLNEFCILLLVVFYDKYEWYLLID